MSTQNRNKFKRSLTLTGSKNSGAARLILLDGPGRGRKYKLEKTALVGRSGVCDVIIDDAEVSRKHAWISPSEGGSFAIEDLGSSNGTAINGVPIKGKVPLHIGDKIQLAERVVLVMTAYDPTEEEILNRQRLETLGRLSAGLAHDFNNMQSVITAGLDHVCNLGDAKVSDEHVADTLRDIIKASYRASELARSLMGYAWRDQDGYAAVDVSYICAEVLKFLARAFDKSISLEAEVSSELYVVGSSAKLHQMLMNLCVNARDAMPTGGLLCVRAELISSGDEIGMDVPIAEDHVLITVTDSGEGMDEETTNRIFEPFFTTKTEQAGFGLGLATVKDIVASHGGTMSVQSAVDQGSTFRICLPASASPKARRAESLTPAAPQVPRLPKGTLVLVAEDEEIVLRTFRRILERAGCRVITASDGLEVVSCYAAQSSRPDLVLLDLDMPTATGEDAITSLRQLDPHVRILVVSGHVDEVRERAVMSQGALGFLPKPFSASVLVTAVLGALHSEGSLAEEKTTLAKQQRPLD